MLVPWLGLMNQRISWQWKWHSAGQDVLMKEDARLSRMFFPAIFLQASLLQHSMQRTVTARASKLSWEVVATAVAKAKPRQPRLTRQQSRSRRLKEKRVRSPSPLQRAGSSPATLGQLPSKRSIRRQETLKDVLERTSAQGLWPGATLCVVCASTSCVVRSSACSQTTHGRGRRNGGREPYGGGTALAQSATSPARQDSNSIGCSHEARQRQQASRRAT